MPTFRHGRGTELYFDDEDVAAFFREAGLNRGVDLAETSAFGTFDKTFVVGMREGRLTVAGMFSGGADEVNEQLDALLGQEAAVPVTYAPEGTTFGRRTYHGAVEETTYDISSPYNDMVATSAEMVSTGGAFGGHSYHARTAETANGNSTNIDNGASSAFGATAALHVVTNTRNGALVGKGPALGRQLGVGRPDHVLVRRRRDDGRGDPDRDGNGQPAPARSVDGPAAPRSATFSAAPTTRGVSNASFRRGATRFSRTPTTRPGQLQPKNEIFEPKWSWDNDPEWRQKVHDSFLLKAKSYADDDFPAVQLLPVWHGTKPEILDSICRVGYANIRDHR